MTRPTRDHVPQITPEARRRLIYDAFRPKPIPSAAEDHDSVEATPAVEEAKEVVAVCRFR